MIGHQEDFVQNLGVIAKAWRAAGLDGSLKITDGEEEPLFMHRDSLDELSEVDRATLCKAGSDCFSYDAAEDRIDKQLIFTASVRSPKFEVEIELPDDDVGHEREQGIIAQALDGKEEEFEQSIEALGEHAQFLSKNGFAIFFDRHEWEEGDGEIRKYVNGCDRYYSNRTRHVTLYVVAMLDKAVSGEEIKSVAEAVRVLTSFGSLNASICKIPLGVNFFGRSAPAKEIIKSFKISPNNLREMAEDWNQCGKNYRFFAASGMRGREALKDEKIKYLVQDFIARGQVTVLAGKLESGKSTFAHELAVAIGTPSNIENRPTSWWGVDLPDLGKDPRVVFLSGEDSKSLIGERMARLDPNGNASGIMHLTANDFESLGDLIAELLLLLKLDLVIVDPARPFIKGNEDSSDTTSDFFSAFTPLRDKFNCAILIVHHLKKGKGPKNPDELLPFMRGSGVFGDRPRAVIGMVAGKGVPTQIGLAKCNYPGVKRETKYFRRDDDTHRHILVEKTETKKNEGRRTPSLPNVPSSEIIVAGVATLSAQGKPVTKTGKNSLHGRKAPEVNGHSRSATEKAVEIALDSGALVLIDGHLFVPGTDEQSGTGKAHSA